MITQPKNEKNPKVPKGAIPEATADLTIKKWMPLIVKLARHYEVVDLTLNDRIAIGMEIAWKAHEHYDPSRGASFLTYLYNMLSYRFRSERHDSSSVHKRRMVHYETKFSEIGGEDWSFFVNTIPGPDLSTPDPDEVFAVLPELHRFIAVKLTQGYKQKQIGFMLGLSKARIGQRLEEIRIMMKRKQVSLIMIVRHVRRYNTKRKVIDTVDCSYCDAKIGEYCKTTQLHPERYLAFSDLTKTREDSINALKSRLKIEKDLQPQRQRPLRPQLGSVGSRP